MSAIRSGWVGDLLIRSILYLGLGWFTAIASAQSLVYDFSANASAAGWASTGGTVNYGAAFDAAKGGVAVRGDLLENGAPASHLWTQPPSSPAPGWIEGTFTNIAIPADTILVRFESEVGFESSASDSTGLNFSLLIEHGGEFFELSQIKVNYDAHLNTLSADLTAYKGQTLTLKLRAEAGADAANDRGAWKNPRIVTEGATLYDFVASAASANFWGSAPNWTTFTFPRTPPYPLPAAAYSGYACLTSAPNNVAEDGVTYSGALEMIPNWTDYPNTTTYHYTQGTWNNFTIPSTYEKIQFQAKVGLLNNAAGASDGVNFELWTNESPTSYTCRLTVPAKYDGKLDTISFDLTPFKGHTFYQFTLRVVAANPTSPNQDYAIWTEAKINGTNPVQVIDFYSEADDDDTTLHNTNWTSGSPSPNNILNLPCSSSFGGLGQYASLLMEDNVSYANVLLTHPNYDGVNPSFIQGIFDNVIIPNNWTNVRFKAKVGFSAGTASANGVAFQVLVLRRGKVDTVCAVTKPYNNSVVDLEGNLSGYQGENVSIILYVDALANSGWDRACWINPRITADLPTQVYGADTGVIVNDGIDDKAALDTAVTLAKWAAPCEILLSAGTHNLNTKLTLSNPNNLNIKGSVVSEAYPTILVNADPKAETFTMHGGKNIAVRNLVIDYSSLPFTQGTLTSLNSGKYRLVIDPGAEYKDLDHPFFNDASLEYAGTFHEAAPPYRQPESTVEWTTISSKSRTAGVPSKSWEVTFSSSGGVAVGMKFQLNGRAGGGSACSFNSSTVDGYVIWDNVTLYAASGCGFAGVGFTKAFVRNCAIKIKPASDRIKSTNADGVHYQACAQGPDVIDSTFEGMTDDGTNFYTQGYKIRAYSSPASLTVETEGRPLFAGNHLTFFRPSTGALGTATVQVVTASAQYELGGAGSGIWCKDISIDRAPNGDIQAGADNDRFFCEEWGSNGYLVTGCTFRNFRGKGVVGEAAGGVVIGNTIEYLNNPAIWLSNYISFNAGLLTKNVLVENNTINRCGTDYNFIRSRYSGVIYISLLKNGYIPGASIGHENITIRNNHLTDWPRHAIYVSNAKNVTISGNTLTNTIAGPKAASGWRGVMMFDNVADVSVTNNIVNDARPANLVNGQLFRMSNTPAGELTTSGNSYTMNWSGPEVTAISSYTAPTFLSVTINPAEAVAAGGQWRRTNTALWLNSGATESGLAAGSYTIEFKALPGWITPAPQSVSIVSEQITTAAGTYVVQLPEPGSQSLVYVEFGYAGLETGTLEWPFNTLGEGLIYLAPGGTLRLKGGGASGERLRITGALRIDGVNGGGRIGAGDPPL